LGSLTPTHQINRIMRGLLDSTQTLVRVEAYRVLARNTDPATKDNSIFSRVIDEKFVLDIVPSEGPPVVYASRAGLPRLALIGKRSVLDLPMTFTTMDSRLMIASTANGKTVTIFYRPTNKGEPVKIESRPELAEIIARLGGEGDGDARSEERRVGKEGE